MTDTEKQRTIKLAAKWQVPLQEEFDADYMVQLSAFLRDEKRKGNTIYPKGAHIFNALDNTLPEQVKVVILGQDPYHGPGQAHGLSFSVPAGVPIPPSLKNIYKELSQDVAFTPPRDGNLTAWAKQGVLLLNAVLTVEKGKAGSHQGKGWERFTDAVIQYLSDQGQHIAFLLWGAYAQKKGSIIDRSKHLVLHAPHPSPLSAHRGFFGCRHFSQANTYLERHDRCPIDWQL